MKERERERTEREIYKERGRTERKEVCRQRERERLRSHNLTRVWLIRDSSDSNPRFYIATCAGESRSGLLIEKWEFTSWCRCSAYLFQLYFADLSSKTRGLSHLMIILQVNRNDFTLPVPRIWRQTIRVVMMFIL